MSVLGSILEGILTGLAPTTSSARVAWAATGLCAVGAVLTFINEVPRAPELLAALAVFLAGMLLIPRWHKFPGLTTNEETHP